MGSQVHALGFGRVHVHSALGEPLRAEIELNGIQGDTVQAGLAPASAYSQRNLEYSPTVGDIRSQLLQTADGRVLMRLRSSRPIAEPFVDLVVRAADAGGHVVKDFSLLLDPPKGAAPAPQPQYAAAPSPRQAQQIEEAVPAQDYYPSAQRQMPRGLPATPAVRTRRSYPVYNDYAADDADLVSARPKAKRRAVADSGQIAAQAMKRSRARSGPYASGSRATASQRHIPAHAVRVRYGQTASGIALSRRQPGATLSQMLVALVQANPHAFIDGNVHRLRAGAVLHMPTRAQVQAISAAEARQMLARNQGVVTYQSRMAHAPVTLEKPAYTVKDTASASTTSPAAVVTQPPAPPVVSSTPDTTNRVAARPEVVEDTANHSPVVVTSVPLVAPSAAKAVTPVQPPSAVQVPDVVVAPASATDPVVTPLAAASATETNLTPKEGGELVEDPNALPPLPAGLSMPTASAVEMPAVPEPVVAPAPVEDAKHREPTDGSSSYLQSLFDDPLILGGGVALLALLGGWGYMQTRRRRADRSRWMNAEKDKGRDSVQFELTGFARPGGGAGGRLSELTQMQNGNSEFMYSAMEYSHSQLRHAGDEIDAVMEADVYLAYGRDTQAEEILKDAINNRPTWVAAHAKLLEIYRSRRDTKAYAETAATVKALTHAKGPEWTLARSNGLALDPDNPLYQEEYSEEVADTPEKPVVAAAGAALASAAQTGADVDTISEGVVQKEAESSGPDFLLDDAEPVRTVAAMPDSVGATPLAFDAAESAGVTPDAAYAFDAAPPLGQQHVMAGMGAAAADMNLSTNAFPDTSLLALSEHAGVVGSGAASYLGGVGHAPVAEAREEIMPWNISSSPLSLESTTAGATAQLSDAQPEWMMASAAPVQGMASDIPAGLAHQPALQPESAWAGAAGVGAASIPEPVLDWSQASSPPAHAAVQPAAAWQSDTVMLTESDVMLSARASELLKSARAQYAQPADQQPDLDISLDLSDLSAEDVAAVTAQQAAPAQQFVPPPSFMQPVTPVDDLSAELARADEAALLGARQDGQVSYAEQAVYGAERFSQEAVRRAPSFADGTMVPDTSSTLQTTVPGRTGTQGSPFLGQLIGAMRTPADLHPKGHVTVPPAARDDQR